MRGRCCDRSEIKVAKLQMVLVAPTMATGADGMTINLPGNGHDTDRIGLLGQVASAAIGA